MPGTGNPNPQNTVYSSISDHICSWTCQRLWNEMTGWDNIRTNTQGAFWLSGPCTEAHGRPSSLKTTIVYPSTTIVGYSPTIVELYPSTSELVPFNYIQFSPKSWIIIWPSRVFYNQFRKQGEKGNRGGPSTRMDRHNTMNTTGFTRWGLWWNSYKHQKVQQWIT